MNIFNLTSKIAMALMLFCAAAQAMKPAATGKNLPVHDKFITEVQIDGGMPDFQRIYFMPYTEGPRMGVQEVPGVTLNGIQDYASTLMHRGTWKPGQTLIYKLQKPVLINIATHNPEFLIAIERLDNTGNTWPFKEKDIKKMGEFNALNINVSVKEAQKQVTIRTATK